MCENVAMFKYTQPFNCESDTACDACIGAVKYTIAHDILNKVKPIERRKMPAPIIMKTQKNTTSGGRTEIRSRWTQASLKYSTRLKMGLLGWLFLCNHLVK